MPEFERIQQSTPGTLSQQWQEDGVAVDPGTVTVGIVRADGTEVVAPGTTTNGTSMNPRTFNLTTVHTALLDRLKVTWTSSAKGTLGSFVEVVGGFLFSIAQAKADPALASLTTAEIAERRTIAESELERACGIAFVPRYERERITALQTFRQRTLRVTWPIVRNLREAIVNGVALDSTQRGLVIPVPGGLHYPSTWGFFAYPSVWAAPTGFAPMDVTVGYEHGYDFPPGGADRAALALAKRGPVDVKAPAGTVTLARAGEEMFRYAPAATVWFGIREVDFFIEHNRLPAVA